MKGYYRNKDEAQEFAAKGFVNQLIIDADRYKVYPDLKNRGALFMFRRAGLKSR